MESALEPGVSGARDRSLLEEALKLARRGESAGAAAVLERWLAGPTVSPPAGATAAPGRFTPPPGGSGAPLADSGALPSAPAPAQMPALPEARPAAGEGLALAVACGYIMAAAGGYLLGRRRRR